MLCLRVIVRGRVQGVFYRSSTKTKADELGIKGWVQNQSDGSVIMNIEGSEKKVDEMINWCKLGPQFASVENLNKELLEFKDYKDFEIRY